MAQDSWRFPLFSLPMANERKDQTSCSAAASRSCLQFAKVIDSLTGSTTVNLRASGSCRAVCSRRHPQSRLSRSRISLIAAQPPAGAALSSGSLAYAFLTRFGHVPYFVAVRLHPRHGFCHRDDAPRCECQADSWMACRPRCTRMFRVGVFRIYERVLVRRRCRLAAVAETASG